MRLHKVQSHPRRRLVKLCEQRRDADRAQCQWKPESYEATLRIRVTTDQTYCVVQLLDEAAS